MLQERRQNFAVERNGSAFTTRRLALANSQNQFRELICDHFVVLISTSRIPALRANVSAGSIDCERDSSAARIIRSFSATSKAFPGC
jgi:hypothetical protein